MSKPEDVLTAARQVLFFASYCGDDTDECTAAKPCPVCLGMSNVYSIPEGTVCAYVRELAPEWNAQPSEAEQITTYLYGMADSSKNHGHVDATSYHAAYEQGIREAIAGIRSGNWRAAAIRGRS